MSPQEGRHQRLKHSVKVAVAEFEEKSYETAFNCELSSNGRVFGAGQVAEAVLGYDAVANVGKRSLIWNSLGAASRPKGLKLLPRHWLPAEEPSPEKLQSVPVNLVLQYKRPDFLAARRGSHSKFWADEPYFRFRVRDRQHAKLVLLEGSTANSALVRYAAPIFASQAELEQHILNRSTIDNSGFVSPAAFGGHDVWTYNQLNAAGHFNPSGESAEFCSWESLISPSDQSNESENVAFAGGLVLALMRFATDIRESAIYSSDRANPMRSIFGKVVESADRWHEELNRNDSLREQLSVDAVRDLAIVSTAADLLNVTWSMLSRS